MTERIVFAGRVQGVGFRQTTKSIAKRHPVKGYVKNLPDGTVELVAQGEDRAIHALLADIASAFPHFISDLARQPLDSSEEFQTFEVRF